MCRIVALAIAVLVLTACTTTTPQEGVRRYLAQYDMVDPHPHDFKICYAHSCQQITQVRLNAEQWECIHNIFVPRPQDGATERGRIALAIGELESMVGPLTGTEGDIGGSFQGAFRNHQMDCEDEAVNTLIYLTMMEQDGLIAYHDIYRPTSRGFVIMGWPHTATVLVDKETKEKFAIDSWFGDNGHPAYVVPLKKWKWGWRPKDDEEE
jgi:hypothetical protein